MKKMSLKALVIGIVAASALSFSLATISSSAGAIASVDGYGVLNVKTKLLGVLCPAKLPNCGQSEKFLLVNADGSKVYTEVTSGQGQGVLTTLLVPGTYTIVPLYSTSGNPQSSPLRFTIAAHQTQQINLIYTLR